jgi:mono/diheme cytochrome c family protein
MAGMWRAVLSSGGVLGGLLALVLTGCEKVPSPEFRANRVEWVKQERLNLEADQHLPGDYRTQVDTLLTSLFGTPDDPRLPAFYGESDPLGAIISLERLKQAAGPVSSDEQGRHLGLYREHCAHCHGITGDGAGPTALALYPYPRDFRLGKYKFKSTPLRRPPTDDDLVRIIRQGIPGSAMPAFTTLPEDEVLALVDYVKYLTIRGEYERRLVAELPGLEGEPLVDLNVLRSAQPKPSAAEGSAAAAASEPTAEQTALDEQLQTLVGEYLYEEIVDRWSDRDDAITEVPAPPAELMSAAAPPAEWVAKGRDLFFGKANCVQCHGATGLGDGQTQNYDDWTNDWLKTPGVDVLSRQTYQHFLEAGALPPRPVRPRNLRVPVYRGGNAPADIYRRIANGIEGTPMPSSPSLTPEEVWAVVAYVQAMPYERLSGGDAAAAAPQAGSREVSGK